jgi:hypothetical protein
MILIRGSKTKDKANRFFIDGQVPNPNPLLFLNKCFGIQKSLVVFYGQVVLS